MGIIGTQVKHRGNDRELILLEKNHRFQEAFCILIVFHISMRSQI